MRYRVTYEKSLDNVGEIIILCHDTVEDMEIKLSAADARKLKGDLHRLFGEQKEKNDGGTTPEWVKDVLGHMDAVRRAVWSRDTMQVWLQSCKLVAAASCYHRCPEVPPLKCSCGLPIYGPNKVCKACSIKGRVDIHA